MKFDRFFCGCSSMAKASICLCMVTLLLAFCCAQDSISSVNCLSPGANNKYEVKCSFDAGLCGWRNITGFKHCCVNESCDYTGNCYIRHHLANEPVNTTARLQSPWFCAMEDRVCTLDFLFYHGLEDRCQLSVFIVSSRNTSYQLTWKESTPDKHDWHVLPSPLTIECPDCQRYPFQIIFQGRKLTNKPCGDKYDEIDIDRIVYKCSGSQTAAPTHIPSEKHLTNTPWINSTGLMESSITTSVVMSQKYQRGSSSVMTMWDLVSTDGPLFTSGGENMETCVSCMTKNGTSDDWASSGQMTVIVLISILGITVFITTIVLDVIRRRKRRKSARESRTIIYTAGDVQMAGNSNTSLLGRYSIQE